MEAIVRDGLPAGAYEFQSTLSNSTRPDCLIRMPGDSRALVDRRQIPAGGVHRARRLRATKTRAARRSSACAPTSAGTSRTSPSAI